MTDSHQQHTQALSDLNKAFDSGSVFRATSEELEGYLRAIGTLNSFDSTERIKTIVRALSINHVQMAQVIRELRDTIKKLNRENDTLAKRIFWLTLVCAVGTLSQVIIGLLKK